MNKNSGAWAILIPTVLILLILAYLQGTQSLFIATTMPPSHSGLVAMVPQDSSPFTPSPVPTAISLGPSPEPTGSPTLTSLIGAGRYLKVTEGCGPDYSGTCINVRSGASESNKVVAHLRTGVVLKIAEEVVVDGRTWYKIALDTDIRYPERVTNGWYVAADLVEAFNDEGDVYLPAVQTSSSTKHIIVDRGDQMLYAYDGDVLFMKESVSTGLDLTPTPRGAFTIYKKTPSRYMQGPLLGVSDQYYDLPGVPWNLYFTEQGGAIHGAYWHNKFGQQWSHGCVNLPPDQAEKLYKWADIGTSVVVHD